MSIPLTARPFTAQQSLAPIQCAHFTLRKLLQHLPIYSKRIATQANRVSDVMRAAKKPTLNKNFTEDVVRLHAELSDVR
jgi:hypothetical protein